MERRIRSFSTVSTCFAASSKPPSFPSFKRWGLPAPAQGKLPRLLPENYKLARKAGFIRFQGDPHNVKLEASSDLLRVDDQILKVQIATGGFEIVLANGFGPLFLPDAGDSTRKVPSLVSSPTIGISQVRRYTSTAHENTLKSKPPFSIFRDVSPLRSFRRSLLLSKPQRTLGLVPTMGAIHPGHLSLIRLAAQENTNVAVSIYLNPTQFAPHEDLASYPKTWQTDIELLSELDAELAQTPNAGRITIVFAPTTRTMYPTLPPSSDSSPTAPGSFIYMYPLASLLEGASRPIFFRGVATVCMKLFNIIQPERVYFGQKDIQQTVVIKRLVKDFHLPIDVRVGPTIREGDGLAMSSRNVYLGARRRNTALVLSRALKIAEAEYEQGRVKRGDILGPALQLVDDVVSEQQDLEPGQRARVELDYLSLADPDSLEEIKGDVDTSRGAILSGAVKMLLVEEPAEGEDCGLGGGQGVVRLIDNIILRPRS